MLGWFRGRCNARSLDGGPLPEPEMAMTFEHKAVGVMPQSSEGGGGESRVGGECLVSFGKAEVAGQHVGCSRVVLGAQAVQFPIRCYRGFEPKFDARVVMWEANSMFLRYFFLYLYGGEGDRH